MAVRSCRVSCRDPQGVEHTVESVFKASSKSSLSPAPPNLNLMASSLLF
jgi:hypothetical protein